MQPGVQSSASSICLSRVYILFFYLLLSILSQASVFSISSSPLGILSQCYSLLPSLSPEIPLPLLRQQGSAGWEEGAEARTFSSSVHYSFLWCSCPLHLWYVLFTLVLFLFLSNPCLSRVTAVLQSLIPPDTSMVSLAQDWCSKNEQSHQRSSLFVSFMLVCLFQTVFPLLFFSLSLFSYQILCLYL